MIRQLIYCPDQIKKLWDLQYIMDTVECVFALAYVVVVDVLFVLMAMRLQTSHLEIDPI